MKKRYFIVIAFGLLIFNACKKDEIDTVNITGNVKNNCTDSGWANVTVHLFTNYLHSSLFKHKSSTDEISTVTNSRGDFVFSNFSINQNSDYSYTLSIDDLDHSIGGIPPQDFGHTGISREIDKSNSQNFIQIGLEGAFYLLNYHLPVGTIITPPDSFGMQIYQPIYHKNMPQNLWQSYWGNVTNINYNTVENMGGFPMGWWYFTLNKTKGGVFSTIHDSIYLDMGCNANYNIPW